MIERLRGNSLSASAASARGRIGEETNELAGIVICRLRYAYR